MDRPIDVRGVWASLGTTSEVQYGRQGGGYYRDTAVKFGRPKGFQLFTGLTVGGIDVTRSRAVASLSVIPARLTEGPARERGAGRGQRPPPRPGSRVRERSCKRQVSLTEQTRSIQRLPRSDWVPSWTLRMITACLSARSAALLVGSTPGTSPNVHSASYSSSRPAQKLAVLGWRLRAPSWRSGSIRSRSGRSSPASQGRLIAPLVLVGRQHARRAVHNSSERV